MAVIVDKQYMINADETPKIGFLPSLGKELAIIPSTILLYLAVKSRGNAQIMFGALGAAGVAYAVIPGPKGDGDANLEDAPVNQSNVNRQTVQSFVSRFESGLGHWSSICSNCNTGILKDYSELDDDNFIAVANAYRKKKGTGLKKAIQNTYIADYVLGMTDYEKKVIDRMNRLNLP